MSRNSIVVNLPELDSTTNKLKKVIHDYLIIKSNGDETWNNPGIYRRRRQPDSSKQRTSTATFLPKQITKETDGKFTNPLTGIEVSSETPNAITELEYWQNIESEFISGISSMPNEIKEALKDIKISDLVYWLIEQSILKGNAEGKY